MEMPMGQIVRLILGCVVVSLLGCGGGGSSTPSDSWIRRWNGLALDATGRDHSPSGAREQLGPVRSSRAMAIIHIAMFDAVVAIEGGYESYLSIEPAADGASLKAAIAKAGRDTLTSLYPSQVDIFDQALSEDLSKISDEDSKISGLKVGENAAAAVLADRSGDGSELSEPVSTVNYRFKSDPGKWRADPINPDQTALGANWKLVRPFVLSSAAQFRVAPPPALNSSEYAQAYSEVYRLGGDGVVTPTERTAEQTEIGIFWAYDGTPTLCAPPRLYNQIALEIADQKGLSLVETARLLALVNVAMADAGIAIWESKYFYEFWRPVTGIRESDSGGPTGRGDGNLLTPGDPLFTPLGAPASNLNRPNFTPPFPAYPSGHAGFGGALFQMLRNFFGSDDIPFSFVSDEFNGETEDNQGNIRPLVERSFSNLSEAEEENGQSRIYLGIHWAFDKSAGISQGRQVSDLVFGSVFRPKP